MTEAIIPPGTIWLVGAGPGDPDLLTRKAEKLIRAASVIFYDALVGKGVLELAPLSARLVPVGKRSGRHSKDQRSINDMLVDAALAGERVVRLKGGDVGIFGRAAEEMDALATHGIACHICPGITAASAAAASAGISLTLRGLARKLIFVTAHAKAGDELDLDWQALADPKATLAIYMGKGAAATISRQLVAAGLPADTPVLLIENASLPEERQFSTRLDLLALSAKSALGDGPALMLIGEAARQRRPASDLDFACTQPVPTRAPFC
ncbi:uroporphyrinogen-III C-methyltransferase [Sphingorhabdus sp. 109]|jgi:uroporphyrin-III C-methyltransferase|uniref:uroporphyrinogen-III C-methyltransferase n=1 Tax=Sphingorhabdus sp. 109 TaxID=2653173 RepID=UPI0012F01149|nr:uroporphyrinogen-III C-methyltransferase [Sphingorhabdus sp. 109]VWX60201.1 Uroporphyrinogen-III C-methyltransferase [Sphingorhabdus sp. 109]